MSCSLPLWPQWEPQHQDLSCEQFQQWKRENDPEYQRQGLAGYLRDNGISEARFTLLNQCTSVMSLLSPVHTSVSLTHSNHSVWFAVS